MKKLIIKDISGSINFLFNNKYLIKTLKSEDIIDNEQKTNVYITDIENWIETLFGTYDVFESYAIPSYEHMIDMFSFIISYFSDKNVNELYLSYFGGLRQINSEYRDLFKVLGFKIPRKKKEYLRYKY